MHRDRSQAEPRRLLRYIDVGRRSFSLFVFTVGSLLTGIAAASGRAAQNVPKTVWDKVYTQGQAMRGMEVYRQECSGCHLESLGGADMAPPLAGEAFLTTWNDLSVGDLFERIRISMPQDTPARLTRQQYVDVVAYILQANKFPAGDTDLGHELTTLSQIKILGKASGQK